SGSPGPAGRPRPGCCPVSTPSTSRCCRASSARPPNSPPLRSPKRSSGWRWWPSATPRCAWRSAPGSWCSRPAPRRTRRRWRFSRRRSTARTCRSPSTRSTCWTASARSTRTWPGSRSPRPPSPPPSPARARATPTTATCSCPSVPQAEGSYARGVHLTRLALTDFRSYPELSLELGPGVTTFSGPNGEGKTNLVEAIGYLATLGSHRVATDAPLVRRGADRAVLRAAVTGAQGSTLIEIELNAGVRADYERVLKQRTALLKSAGSKGNLRGAAREAMTSTLDAWDAQLARAGAPLLAGRMRLVAALRPHLTAAYEAVSGGPPGEASGMNYRSSALENSDEFDEIGALETALLKALSGVRASELDRGVCLVGPHRDE